MTCAAVGVTANGACEQLRQCQRVTGGPLWPLWPIYERGEPAAAAHLIYRRPALPRPGRAVAAE